MNFPKSSLVIGRELPTTLAINIFNLHGFQVFQRENLYTQTHLNGIAHDAGPGITRRRVRNVQGDGATVS